MGEDTPDLVWVAITAAGGAMATVIGKLWTHTVQQRDTISRMAAENLELNNKLHAEHKDDLRRFVVVRQPAAAELVEIPWAPSRRPPAMPPKKPRPE